MLDARHGRIHCSDCALADVEGDLPFREGLGYASQLSETGTMRVAARPLDTMGLSPTFLKLHLEGGELAALKGALKTLSLSRPIVAATVYHNVDGVWRTPRWLMASATIVFFFVCRPGVELGQSSMQFRMEKIGMA